MCQHGQQVKLLVCGARRTQCGEADKFVKAIGVGDQCSHFPSQAPDFNGKVVR
jgi:hypothetical protein